MRTTITLDPDVESVLRREVRRRSQPFKQVLNNAIRAGLRNTRPRAEAFKPLTFNMGSPSVDLARASSIIAELEDYEIIDLSAQLMILRMHILPLWPLSTGRLCSASIATSRVS